MNFFLLIMVLILLVLPLYRGIFHIFLGAGVAYLMILALDPKVVQYYVITFSMLHLSWVHLYMQMKNAGVGNLDYIG